MDELQDSVRVEEIRDVMKKRMNQQGLSVPFQVSRIEGHGSEERVYNEVTLGLKNPVTYKLHLHNTFPYLIIRIGLPILLSIFLLAITIVSFSLLFRNLLRQKKLSDIKNEFISNITHELKTPIATVGVAIEALRSFNSTMDKEKTKEYLDISANELQRLSLLVDKVLKLSIFEKKEIDLKYELLDMKALVEEVVASLRLHFEKTGAKVEISSVGNTSIYGDRLHLISVIFNLLDNALKYSKDHPEIHIGISGNESTTVLSVKDKGIGIPSEYREKIFEKFFRVPTGNVHNAKGYGLGLSYVNQVVKKHKGFIRVETSESEGSNFTITLPKNIS
jgi:two-component system phosphate regulon sensor histidine kinase PhoR